MIENVDAEFGLRQFDLIMREKVCEELRDYSSLQQLCVCVVDNQISSLVLSSSFISSPSSYIFFHVSCEGRKTKFLLIFRTDSLFAVFVPVFILTTSLRCRNRIFLVSEILKMKVFCCPLVAEWRHCRSLLRTRFSDDCWTFLKSSCANRAGLFCLVLETWSKFCDCLVLGSAPSSPLWPPAGGA